jgi:hypothetical protein
MVHPKIQRIESSSLPRRGSNCWSDGHLRGFVNMNPKFTLLLVAILMQSGCERDQDRPNVNVAGDSIVTETSKETVAEPSYEMVVVSVTGTASVRNAPTTKGSVVLRTLSVGDNIVGQWVNSPVDPSEKWFEFVSNSQKAYVWGGNLTVQILAPEATVATDNASANSSDAGAAQLEAAEAEVPFPYTAVLSCGLNGFENIDLRPCLSSNGFQTTIELNNGGNYGLYKAYNLPNDWRNTNRGVEISLAKTFSITMGNSHDAFIMGLRIFDGGGNIVFQKQVDQMGTISASN